MQRKGQLGGAKPKYVPLSVSTIIIHPLRDVERMSIRLTLEK